MQDARLLILDNASMARTTAAGRTQLGDIISLGHAHNLGPGHQINFTFKLTLAGTGAGAIMLWELEVANEVAFDTTNVTIFNTTILMAAHTKGLKWRVPYHNQSKTFARVMTTATVANFATATGTIAVEEGDQDCGDSGYPITP